MKTIKKTLALLLILALVLTLPVLAEGEQAAYTDVPKKTRIAEASL